MGRSDATRAYQVCLESIGKIGALCEEIGDSCGFTRKPSAYLASREQDVPGLQAEYAARRAAGIELDYLTRALKIRRLFLIAERREPFRSRLELWVSLISYREVLASGVGLRF